MLEIRLKELRNKANITQKELAEAINTSQQNIAFYEKGERKPKHDMVEKRSHQIVFIHLCYCETIYCTLQRLFKHNP